MVNFVEEALQVYVHDVAVACVDVLLRLEHRLLGVAVGAEAVNVVILKLYLELDGDGLPNRLL